MLFNVSHPNTTFQDLAATETFWFRGDLYLKVKDTATSEYKAVELVTGRIVSIDYAEEVTIAPTILVDANHECFPE